MTYNDKLVKEAIKQAEAWQTRANHLLTSEEKVIQEQLKRLLTNPIDKIIMTKMIDQSFRSHNDNRVADQINYIFKHHGAPDFFTTGDKLLLRLFLGIGRHFPHVSVPKVVDRMREDSSRSVIPGEPEVFFAHLQNRKAEGVRMNINHLGEAVLGEEEAMFRLKTYLEDLHRPEIEYISVKISTIYSQISSLAFDHTIDILVDRLSMLYRAARDNVFTSNNGVQSPKFVNLDMEEYRDLEITCAAFKKTLEKEEFKHHSAGIVLQSYVPDSFEIQKELTEWAKKRVSEGGSPIKIRIVKGANMEMEMVDAAIHNWPLALYDNKPDVDANYKRMVGYGMKPENIRAVYLGIASHNLFELAYAYKLAQHFEVTPYFSFEMLEGMADHIRRAIQETSEEMVLYAPVATKEQFISAIAYLIRRLDENTAEENFLRYAPSLKPGSKEWEFLKEQFIASVKRMDAVSAKPHRIQNRMTETFPDNYGAFYSGEFINEADTDWAIPANRLWAQSIRDKWKKTPKDTPISVPIVICGKEIFKDKPLKKCFDASQYQDQVCIAECAAADEHDIAAAVRTAKQDPDRWREKSFTQRHVMLSRVAAEFRKDRGDLIGAAAAETGKVFSEADPEVSEAIDFAEFYPYSLKTFENLKTIRCSGKGVGLVISPWNFPIAIPAGGILAALASGNTVIFKPASSAILTGWMVCRCFWKAGISQNVLQFLPCSGADAGSKLTNHPDIDFIILTGGTDTGLEILRKRPSVQLAAETGGKNATIVTSMSDRDQAIKNILHSAFSNCGQKCSATSLLILEKEVYEDDHFKKQLLDAAKSYSVGSVWEFQHKMGPLIHPPAGDLKRALTRLEPGESWLLEPKNLDGNPYLWTPGIKWGVQPDSYTHMTEFFGPVLGVMCAKNLDHAIELTNQTGYGLTSGIESLDDREQNVWKDRVQAGNLYINRGTTGAIVLRQPFGGMGKSAIGAGVKAGGMNYASQFMNFEDHDFPSAGPVQNDYRILRIVQEWELKLAWGQLQEYQADLTRVIRAVKSYLFNAEQEFFQEKDYFHLRGQDNIIRYLPVGTVLIRVHENDSLFDILARVAASKISSCTPILSFPSGLKTPAAVFLKGVYGKKFIGKIQVLQQTDDDIIDMMPKINRIRYAAKDRVSESIFEAAAQTGFYIACAPVVMEGRIELIHYFREQSICNTYHRYGNLGERAL